jgi:hypothetical protein
VKPVTWNFADRGQGPAGVARNALVPHPNSLKNW